MTAVEMWRAAFTKTKIVNVETPVQPRVPSTRQVRDILGRDGEITKPLIRLKIQAEYGHSDDEELLLTEEEIKCLGDLGKEKLEKLNAFIKNDFADKLKTEVFSKLSEHQENGWDGYQDTLYQITYNSETDEKYPSYVIALNVGRNDDKVEINNEVYDIPPELFLRILKGAGGKLLSDELPIRSIKEPSLIQIELQGLHI